MIAKLTFSILFVAVAATVYFSMAMTEQIGPLLPAMGQIFYLLGPYIALGALAWITRAHPLLGPLLFGFSVALSSFGVYTYWDAYQHFQQRPANTPVVFNWGPFIAAASQWFVSFCFAVTTFVLYLKHRGGQRR